VPGNHDYYTRHVAEAGLFERYFAPWQAGDRVDQAIYPFARRVGSVWVVGVNSCVGNRWSWDAAGKVGTAQLERLRLLLKKIESGPRILVTHYPVSRVNGKPELFAHNLRDVRDLVTVAAEGGVGLWLHGHRHQAYHVLRSSMAPFPVVCAGSATQQGHWSYNEYVVTGRHVRATRRIYSPKDHQFEDGVSFELEMPA